MITMPFVCMKEKEIPVECVFCFKKKTGHATSDILKDSFGNFDLIGNPKGTGVCCDCSNLFSENTLLPLWNGKEVISGKGKVRNYSYCWSGLDWIAYSRSYKGEILQFLLKDQTKKWGCSITISGQKHILFRAKENEPHVHTFYVQLEDHLMYIRRDDLQKISLLIEELLSLDFTYAEIRAGQYNSSLYCNHITKVMKIEKYLILHRKSLLFELALYLTRRPT